MSDQEPRWYDTWKSIEFFLTRSVCLLFETGYMCGLAALAHFAEDYIEGFPAGLSKIGVTILVYLFFASNFLITLRFIVVDVASTVAHLIDMLKRIK